MIWRKKYFLFLVVWGSILFLGLIIIGIANAGDLSCAVRSNNCDAGEVTIFRMYNTSNSHAGVATSTYTNLVCCSGPTDLGYGCSSTTNKVVLYLSDKQNAHARQRTYEAGSYTTPNATPVCISVPSGAPEVVYVAGSSNCASGYATLGSMSAATNAHVGNETAYTGASNYKICAKVSAAAAVSITRTAGNGVISYGYVALSGTKNTGPGDLNDVETYQNNGNVAELFRVKTSTATGGATPWSVGTSPGNNVFVHSFATTTALTWQILDVADAPETASSSVAVSGTVDFYFKIDTPSGTSVYDTKTITVNIQAIQAP